MSLETARPDLVSSQTTLPPENALASESYVERALPAILTTWDLTALFVIILFFITNDSNAVAGGPAGLTLWIVGGLLFFLPCGIATAQLGVLFPYEGSLYTWTYRTFGRFMSFFVGFVAWVPSALLIVATSELIINILQGLNPKWLVDPWSQGVALLVLNLLTCFVALQHQRVIQYIINGAFILILFVTALVFFSGVAWWLLHKPLATNFAQGANWNPFTGADFPLFGVITLGYLGVNLPLNLGGELASPHGPARRRSISQHVLWGSLIVLVCYLLSTFGILVVEGQNASFVLFAPVSTVQAVLGSVMGDITAICIMTILFIATVAYNSICARFLLVGGIDRRLPRRLGRLNHRRIPAFAIRMQTAIACALAILFFMGIPYMGILAGPPAHLSTSIYFISIGTATVLWAFATIFLFVNLLWLLLQKRILLIHRILPTWLLVLSSVVGLGAGVVAIVDTVLNSYDPPNIGNNIWWYVIVGFTVAFLILAAITGMMATSEANWEEMTEPR